MRFRTPVVISILAAVSAVSPAAEAQIAPGPGLPMLEFSESEVFRPLSKIQTRNGHSSVDMVGGYMMLIYSKDGVTGDGGIVFYDISDPREPVRVAEHYNDLTKPLIECHTVAYSTGYAGVYALMAATHGIQFWDLTDVKNPELLNYMKLDGLKPDYANATFWVSWQAPYAFVGGNSNGLYVVDAADPRDPKLLAHLPTTKIGDLRGGMVYPLGNLLYITAVDSEGYSVMDISNPAEPVLLDVVIAEKIYSGFLYGDYLLGAGQDGRMHVYDGSRPDELKKLGESDTPAKKGAYFSIQDDIAFMGASTGFGKLSLDPEAGFPIVRKVSSGVEGGDDDYPVVLGNLVFVGNDHSGGSVILPHQEAPDTRSPEVKRVVPAPGAGKQPATTRIGISMTDKIDLASLVPENFQVRPRGGSPLTGKLSHQMNLLHFSPDQALKPNTVYEILLPAGGLRDVAGNPLAGDFRAVFSTGEAPTLALEPVANHPGEWSGRAGFISPFPASVKAFAAPPAALDLMGRRLQVLTPGLVIKAPAYR